MWFDWAVSSKLFRLMAISCKLQRSWRRARQNCYKRIILKVWKENVIFRDLNVSIVKVPGSYFTQTIFSLRFSGSQGIASFKQNSTLTV